MEKPILKPRLHLLDRRIAYLTDDEEKEIAAFMQRLFPGLGCTAAPGNTRPEDPPSQGSGAEPESMTDDDINGIIEASYDKYFGDAE